MITSSRYYSNQIMYICVRCGKWFRITTIFYNWQEINDEDINLTLTFHYLHIIEYAVPVFIIVNNRIVVIIARTTPGYRLWSSLWSHLQNIVWNYTIYVVILVRSSELNIISQLVGNISCTYIFNNAFPLLVQIWICGTGFSWS